MLGKNPNRLDDDVTVWSDFLASRFHPRTIQVLNEYRHNDELNSFDIFPQGEELLRNYETTCEWEDRLHFFTEECDSLQGFHVLMDTHNGFGGLTSGILKYLEDEFPGKGVLTYGFTPADLPDDTAAARSSRIINSALSYEAASSHSSLFVPASLSSGLWRVLGPPCALANLQYQPGAYHTSAVLAASIDTASQPYRLDKGAIGLADITHSFNFQGRKMACVNTSLPLGMYQNESLVDFLATFTNEQHSYPWRSLTPHVRSDSPVFAQSVVMRGVKPSQVASDTDPRKLPHYLTGLSSREEAMRNFLSEKSSGNPFALDCLNSPVKTTIPFPHIFSQHMTRTGYLCDSQRPSDMGVEEVPMMTSLQSSAGLAATLDCLHGAASKMNMKKHHRYLEAGIEEDDYTYTLDNLMSLREAYCTNAEALS